ncbi:putative RBR-type E3 ubiquitin transferase [Microsporum ferrugineum]
MHRAIRKLTRLTRRAGQWSKNSIENEMKRKHLSFDDGYGPPGFGGRGASSSESHDDDGMGFLISLLVPDRGDNKTSKSGLTQTGLKNIFTLFPDICPRYLTTLYQDMLTRKIRICEEAMVDAILQREAYPTKNDSKRRKLAEDKGKQTRWGYGDQVKRDTRYWKCCKSLLKLDFPLVPMPYIVDLINMNNGCLYNAYLELDKKEATYETLNPKPYTKEPGFKNSKAIASLTKEVAKHQTKDTHLEIQDARAERTRRTMARAAKERHLKLEDQNLAYHTATGGLIECHCCYTDTPLNRTITCTATEAHPFCWKCIKFNAEIQIGMMKYDIQCMDMSGCKANFSKDHLVKSIGGTLMKKLSDLQQREEIDKAGLEDLEECPFCDYKAIYPPIEENREFRCLKPECMRVSCRKCHRVSHIPKTCQEMEKEKHVPIRQKIEEAMSEAIIRICPNEKCKTPIIKEYGCNKMWCAKCRTVMCYVCKQNITKSGYKHFAEMAGSSKCLLHDTYLPISRHHDELTKAHRTAVDKVLKENPELREEDIGVKPPSSTETRSAPLPFRHRLIDEADWNRFGLPPRQPQVPVLHDAVHQQAPQQAQDNRRDDGRLQNQQQLGAQAAPEPNVRLPAAPARVALEPLNFRYPAALEPPNFRHLAAAAVAVPEPQNAQRPEIAAVAEGGVVEAQRPVQFQVVGRVGVLPTAWDTAHGALPQPFWYERYGYVPQPPPPGIPVIQYQGHPVINNNPEEARYYDDNGRQIYFPDPPLPARNPNHRVPGNAGNRNGAAQPHADQNAQAIYYATHQHARHGGHHNPHPQARR